MRNEKRGLFVARSTSGIMGYLSPDPEEARDELSRRLGAFDGGKNYLTSMWQVSPQLTKFDRPTPSDLFMQAAGTAEAMTVEMRAKTDRGAEMFKVGRPIVDPTDTDETVIPLWPGKDETLQRHEVLTAAEAIDAFMAYYLTGVVTRPFTLRSIELWPDE